MMDLEKIDTATSKRSTRSQQREDLTRVCSAPHIDNQTVFYPEDELETNGSSTLSSDQAGVNNDVENAPPAELEKSQTSKSQRSQRDPKLVRIGCCSSSWRNSGF